MAEIRVKGGGALLAAVLCACTGGALAEPALRANAPSPPGAAEEPARVQRRVEPREAARFEDPKRAEKLLAALQERQAEFEQSLRALGAPGFAWGLVVDDKLLLARGDGRLSIDAGGTVTPDTIFRIGSITKVFSALAVVQLRDAGRVALDVPAATYLPELDGVIYPAADAPAITVRHLLTHVSGLPRLGSFRYSVPGHAPSEEEVLGALQGVLLSAPPGVEREYSNFAYSLLGVLVGRVAQQPYEAYVTQRILQPLGMLHSAWDAAAVPAGALARPHEAGQGGALKVVPEWTFGASSGAGGIYSSVTDMARFMALALSAWPVSSLPESPVLRRASLRESQRMQSVRRLRSAPEPPRAMVAGNGLGWSVYQDCRFEDVVWHNGGTEGHSSSLHLLPSRGVGLMVLANRADLDLDAPSRKLLEALHDAGVLPERRMPPQLEPRAREAFDAALALGWAFDLQRFEALFSERTRQYLPAEKLRPYLEAIAASAGRCRTGAALEAGDSRWRAAALECEKGEPLVLAGVLDPASQLLAIWAGTQEKHAKEVQERAQKSAPSAACQPSK